MIQSIIIGVLTGIVIGIPVFIAHRIGLCFESKMRIYGTIAITACVIGFLAAHSHGTISEDDGSGDRLFTSGVSYMRNPEVTDSQIIEHGLRYGFSAMMLMLIACELGSAERKLRLRHAEHYPYDVPPEKFT